MGCAFAQDVLDLHGITQKVCFAATDGPHDNLEVITMERVVDLAALPINALKRLQALAHEYCH